MKIADFFPQRPSRIMDSQRARPRKPTANWRRRMYLHAEQLPLTHIMECFGDHYTVVDGSSERASQYDYCLEFTSEFPPGFEDMVQLLTDALCLPPEEPLDLALALDRYKVPDDDLPATAWANTEIGELVHRAKYYKSSPGLQEAARETLAERLAGAIQSHPAYWRAPYLVSVPGRPETVRALARSSRGLFPRGQASA